MATLVGSQHCLVKEESRAAIVPAGLVPCLVFSNEEDQDLSGQAMVGVKSVRKFLEHTSTTERELRKSIFFRGRAGTGAGGQSFLTAGDQRICHLEGGFKERTFREQGQNSIKPR